MIFGWRSLLCLFIVTALFSDEVQSRRRRGRRGKKKEVVYAIKGAVQCKGATDADKAQITTKPDFGHISDIRALRHHVNQAFFQGNTVHKATVKFGGEHGILVGGRTKAEAISIMIMNSNPSSGNCKEKIFKTVMLSDFGTEERKNKKGGDTHRKIYDIGTCHLDTGNCDGSKTKTD